MPNYMFSARVGCAVVSIFSLWASITLNSKSAQADNKSALPKVITKRISMESIKETTVLPGVVEAPKAVVVTGQTEGKLTRCKAQVGQSVKKGQTLCWLQNSDPALTFQPVPVLAPSGGVISQILVTENSVVQKNQAIVEIVDPTASKFVVFAPGLVAAPVELGRTATWEGLDKKSLGDLILTLKSPLPEGPSRAFRIEFKAVKGALPLGKVGRLILTGSEKKALRVPEAAINYQGKDPIVKTVEGTKAKFHLVTLGESDGENVEIVGGLPEGALVVVKSSAYVADGAEVDLEGAPRAQK